MQSTVPTIYNDSLNEFSNQSIPFPFQWLKAFTTYLRFDDFAEWRNSTKNKKRSSQLPFIIWIGWQIDCINQCLNQFTVIPYLKQRLNGTASAAGAYLIGAGCIIEMADCRRKTAATILIYSWNLKLICLRRAAIDHMRIGEGACWKCIHPVSRQIIIKEIRISAGYTHFAIKGRNYPLSGLVFANYRVNR